MDVKLQKQIAVLMFPLTISNLLGVVSYIIDNIWVGNLLGEYGVSAISSCYPIVVLMNSILNGFVTATTVLVSQYYGSNEVLKIKKIMGVSYKLGFLTSIVLAIVISLSASVLLSVLNTPSAIFNYARGYLIITAITFAINYFICNILGALKGLGDMKTPMLFVVIETILNIILVPGFILWGRNVIWVGFANFISKIVVLILIVLYIKKSDIFIKLDRQYFEFNRIYTKQLIGVGFPIIIEQILIALVITFETFVSNETGVVGSATYGVVGRLEQIFLVIGQSLQLVATVMVGQYYGTKQFSNIRKFVWNGLVFSTIPSLLIVLIVFVFPDFFCEIFVNSSEVIIMAVDYLSIVGFAYILLPFRLFLNGFVIGTTHTKYIFWTSIISVSFEILIMLLLLQFGVNNMVILSWSILAYVLADILLKFSFFLSKKWCK